MTAPKEFLMLVGITLKLFLMAKVILLRFSAQAAFLTGFQFLFQQLFLMGLFVITME
jgi:hypothetical protein